MTTRRSGASFGRTVPATLIAITLFVIMLFAPTSARAGWREARSTHFTVYANTTEADLRTTATRLENFDALIRVFHSLPSGDAQGLSPVTVYVLPDEAAVQKLYGSKDEPVADSTSRGYRGRSPSPRAATMGPARTRSIRRSSCSTNTAIISCWATIPRRIRPGFPKAMRSSSPR